jgi:uncharacterized protein (TIGR02391 family)
MTPAQMRAGIPQLQRRVDELTATDFATLKEDTVDDMLGDLGRRVDDTLARVFGNGTIEYHRYSPGALDQTPLSLNFSPFSEDRGASLYRRLPYIKKGVASAISTLNSAISILTERLQDSGETAATRAITAYSGLDLHDEIARAASQLYRDGHYANAVEAGVKALNNLVRLRSDLEIDGVALMQKAFNPNGPILKFNSLSDQSDKDEQMGFMWMFSGAVSGLRNPRAHKFIQDDPERALEFIAFVGLLAKLLDQAKK